MFRFLNIDGKERKLLKKNKKESVSYIPVKSLLGMQTAYRSVNHP
jgi:hypothetical protein